MAREKPPEAGVPEWILTYGDMMSLLLCFFIMLFSMSTLQVVKVQAAIESLREGFGYTGASMSPQERAANATRPRINTTGRAKRMQAMSGGQPIVAPQGDYDRVMTIRTDEEEVKGGVIRFDPGSDELNEKAKEDLKNLLPELIGSPFKILVVGHESPTEKGMYRRERDLSYTRAVNVYEFLVTEGLRREFFRVEAAGSFEPLSRSVLPAGADPRQANSVVRIMLLSNTVREMESDSSDRELKFLDGVPVQ